MSSIAELLNSLLAQRNALADNLQTKGVEASQTETLNTLVPKVLQIKSTGAVISFRPCLEDGTLNDALIPDMTEKFFQSDTVLNPNLSLNDFTDCSSNITTIEYVSQLMIKVTMSAIADGEELSFQVKASAYKYSNGESALYSKVAGLFLSDIFGDTEGCNFLHLDDYVDNATDSFEPEFNFPCLNSLVDTFTQFRNPVTTFEIGSDSHINFGYQDVEMNFCFNQQDAAIISSGWGIYDTSDAGKVLKVFWNGWSTCESEDEQYYELFFMENGDIVFHLGRIGENTSGTDTFLGTPYPRPANGGCVSFYRQDFFGTEYTIESGDYQISKHNKNADIFRKKTTLIELIDSVGGLAPVMNDTKVRSTYCLATFPDAAIWRRNSKDINTIYFDSDSQIGVGSLSQAVKMCSRDTALFTTMAGCFELTDLGLTCVKCYWKGTSDFSLDEVDRIWELYIFSNGDAMIHVTKMGAETSGGVSTFLGKTYIVTEGSSVSFYRTDAAGTQWNIVQGLYELAKHVIDPS